MTIEDIAIICHNVNKAICEAAADFSQPAWVDLDPAPRQNGIARVQQLIDFPDITPEAEHESWREDRIAAGWTYGRVKDNEKKTNPALVDYLLLPPIQRAKDKVRIALVADLKRFLNEPTTADFTKL